MAEPRRRTAPPDTVIPTVVPKPKAARSPRKTSGPVLVVPGPDKVPAKRRSPKRAAAIAVPDAVVPADPPAGAAAEEVLRIRDGMARIRDLLDAPPVPGARTQALLRTLVQPAVPRPAFDAGPAAVIDHADPVAPIAPSMALVVRPDQAGAAPSRMGRLVSAWGDWLTWKLSPPRIPPEPRTRSTAKAPAAPHPAPPPPAVEQAPRVESDPIRIEDVVATAVAQILADGTLRSYLQSQIHEEMEGEMGARFSANLGALVRRQVTQMLDDRLTHL